MECWGSIGEGLALPEGRTERRATSEKRVKIQQNRDILVSHAVLIYEKIGEELSETLSFAYTMTQ